MSDSLDGWFTVWRHRSPSLPRNIFSLFLFALCAGYGVIHEPFYRLRQWNTAATYYNLGFYRNWTLAADATCPSGQRYSVMNFAGEWQFCNTGTWVSLLIALLVASGHQS